MNMGTKTKKLVLNALFLGMILLLGLTPIGMIPLGFIYISLLAIPVVIGTILLGIKSGLLFGAMFGLISALKAFGIYGAPAGLVAPILAASPILAAALCFLPRLLVPVVTFLVRARFGTKKRGLIIAAVCGSLTNTIFYLGLMLCLYIALGLDASSVLALIGGTGLIAGGAEAVANALISPAIILALQKILEHKKIEEKNA